VAVIVGLTLLGLVSAAGAYLYWQFSCNVMDPEAATLTKRLTTTTNTDSTLRESKQSHLVSTVEGSKQLVADMQSERSAAADGTALLRGSAFGMESSAAADGATLLRGSAVGMESSYAKSTVGGRN